MQDSDICTRNEDNSPLQGNQLQGNYLGGWSFRYASTEAWQSLPGVDNKNSQPCNQGSVATSRASVQKNQRDHGQARKN